MHDRSDSKPFAVALSDSLPSLTQLSADKLKETLLAAWMPKVSIQHQKVATVAAGVLFAEYRRDEVADEDIFVAAVSAVFARYPADVIAEVIHPAHGLPAKSKWRPEVYEIREACEAIMRPRRARKERERSIKAQLADRDAEVQRGQELPADLGVRLRKLADNLRAATARDDLVDHLRRKSAMPPALSDAELGERCPS